MLLAKPMDGSTVVRSREVANATSSVGNYQDERWVFVNGTATR